MWFEITPTPWNATLLMFVQSMKSQFQKEKKRIHAPWFISPTLPRYLGSVSQVVCLSALLSLVWRGQRRAVHPRRDESYTPLPLPEGLGLLDFAIESPFLGAENGVRFLEPFDIAVRGLRIKQW